jgi:hypothetical protein
VSKTPVNKIVMHCHQEVSNSENSIPLVVWKANLEVRKSQQMTLQAGPSSIKFCIQDVNVSLPQGTNILKPEIVGRRIIKSYLK